MTTPFRAQRVGANDEHHVMNRRAQARATTATSQQPHANDADG